MSLLDSLLKAKDPLFSLALRQLEAETGKAGVDTALTGEVLALAYKRAAKLGLRSDFNGKELYYSLIHRAKADDEALAHSIGGHDPTNISEMMPLIVAAARKVDVPRGGWFIKKTVAKRFLRAMPPPNTMARLGYKNVDTMLTHENLFEIYGALRFAEDPKWLDKYLTQYKSLSFKDFEHREVQIIEYDANKWGDIAADFIHKKLHNITHLKELGVVMAMPTGDLKFMPGVTLKALPLMIHYLNEIRLYSAYFKLVSVKKNFGEILVTTLIADTPKVHIMVNKEVHWRVIQRYFGKLPNERHPEIFEPHVQPEDLHWRKAEDVLYKIEPRLKFWRGLDYVALDLKGEIVSFNLMDVSLSYSNQLSYKKRYLYHFRESLWNEIFMRYMGQGVLEEQILKQLDNELIAPEKLVHDKISKK